MRKRVKGAILIAGTALLSCLGGAFSEDGPNVLEVRQEKEPPVKRPAPPWPGKPAFARLGFYLHAGWEFAHPLLRQPLEQWVARHRTDRAVVAKLTAQRLVQEGVLPNDQAVARIAELIK